MSALNEQLRAASKRNDELNVALRNATELADAERLRAEELNVDRNDAALRLQVRRRSSLSMLRFRQPDRGGATHSSTRNTKPLRRG